MSKQRVFSREYTANYADYNKLISGTEILKAVKQSDPDAVIDRFVNYQQFQTLSGAYYLREGDEKVKQAVTNLYDASDSFIKVHPLPSSPVTIGCEPCSKEEPINDCPPEEPVCKKPFLYPYGEIIANKPVQQWFPTPLYMKKWCSVKKTVPILDHDILLTPCQNKDNTKCNTRCSGKVKPLFI
jgi:hypothetical protein